MEAPPGNAIFVGELSDDKLTLGEIQEAARKVEELIAHPGWEVIQGLLGAVYERENLSLVVGPVMPPDATQRKIGLVAGIEAHRRVAQSVIYESWRRSNEAEQTASDE